LYFLTEVATQRGLHVLTGVCASSWISSTAVAASTQAIERRRKKRLLMVFMVKTFCESDFAFGGFAIYESNLP